MNISIRNSKNGSQYIGQEIKGQKEKQWFTKQTLHRKVKIELHDSWLMINKMKESTAKIKFMGFDFVLTAIFRITDTDVHLISSSLSYFTKCACDIYIILFIIITRLTDKIKCVM
jgi:hypothetical protein